MKQYWAIAKRDWGQNAFSYLLFLAYACFLSLSLKERFADLPASLVLLLMLCGVCVFISSQIQQMLALRGIHLGFLLPSVQKRQFNYGLIFSLSILVLVCLLVELLMPRTGFVNFSVILLLLACAGVVAVKVSGTLQLTIVVTIIVFLIVDMAISAESRVDNMLIWLYAMPLSLKLTLAAAVICTSTFIAKWLSTPVLAWQEVNPDYAKFSNRQGLFKSVENELSGSGNLRPWLSQTKLYQRIESACKSWLLYSTDPIAKGLFSSLAPFILVVLTAASAFTLLTPMALISSGDQPIHLGGWQIIMAVIFMAVFGAMHCMVTSALVGNKSQAALLLMLSKMRRTDFMRHLSALSIKILATLSLFVVLLFSVLTALATFSLFGFNTVVTGLSLVLLMLPGQLAITLLMARKNISESDSVRLAIAFNFTMLVIVVTTLIKFKFGLIAIILTGATMLLIERHKWCHYQLEALS